MEHTDPKQYLKARVNDAKVVEGVVMKFSETMPKLDETTGVDKKIKNTRRVKRLELDSIKGRWGLRF